MDASSAESDSSTGHGQSKAVATAPVTPLPNHGGKVGASSVQTLNGANIINSHNSGSASPLTGTSVSSNCISSASDSSAVTAVTVVNNGPRLSNATMPLSSSTVIQTSYTNPQNAVTSSQVASLGSGSTVTLARPSVQIVGSGTTLNGNNNTGPVNAASQLSTTAPCMGFQTLLNNGQPPAPVSVSAGPQIIKAEAPKTIIQSAPQALTPDVVTNTDNFTPGIIINPSLQSAPRTSTAVTAAASQGGIRAIASQVLAPRPPQSSPSQPNVQNIQLPPGVVLVRSETGQLLMIHQQTLAQMQAQGATGPRPAAPAGSPQIQITSAQVPGTPTLGSQVTPTIIRQGSPAPTSAPVTATHQRPPVLQSPIGAALPSASPRALASSTGTTVTLATETMENVKKCKNFLSTLIKLASSGKQSSETAANVRDLVKDLLEGKLEAEDFTSRLYRELNSSPQPNLVTFLKRSLPVLRQLTPDSAAFIQQSHQPATGTPAPAGVLGGPALHPAAPATRPHLQPVISKQALPAQQQGAMVRPPQATAPVVTLRGPAPNRVALGPPQLQVKQLQAVPVVRPGMLPGSKPVPGAASLAAAAQKNRLKEAGAGTFRDDDDINDVASMAGVNLSEESARILATNSEVVGAVTRSCKEEAFLYASTLQRRILEIGKKFGVMDLGPEVVTFVSHATQQRLQNLLEEVSEVAQQRNINFKGDSRYEQTSDVRVQLKFFEQLDQVEKQRKEEQEREILMKAAKSRARQEDPEQLRLKQKAKEMQQQELAQMRQRDANLTALAAIGPRKKRKLGSAASSAGAEGPGSGPMSGSPGSAASRQLTRQRITRVNLRDLLFCLENERDTSLSHLLYRGFLK